MARPWSPRETQMLSDFLAKTFPNADVRVRVRLGPLPDVPPELKAVGIDSNLYKVTQMWSDAVVILPEKVIIIEAKVRAYPSVVGQLLHYKKLYFQTAEFRPYHSRPLELWLLYAFSDQETLRFAEENGIKTINFKPDYIQEYYLERLKKSVRRE
ncbi:hypothetical protein [Huginn virus]|nr:hypothetical protein [Huginn virus]